MSMDPARDSEKIEPDEFASFAIDCVVEDLHGKPHHATGDAATFARYPPPPPPEFGEEEDDEPYFYPPSNPHTPYSMPWHLHQNQQQQQQKVAWAGGGGEKVERANRDAGTALNKSSSLAEAGNLTDAVGKSKDAHILIRETVHTEEGTLSKSESVTVPPIHGIPQRDGFTPDTSQRVEYAKLKNQKSRNAAIPARGIFSNLTSASILERVRPMSKNTPQVAPAGWIGGPAASLHSESSQRSPGFSGENAPEAARSGSRLVTATPTDTVIPIAVQEAFASSNMKAVDHSANGTAMPWTPLGERKKLQPPPCEKQVSRAPESKPQKRTHSRPTAKKPYLSGLPANKSASEAPVAVAAAAPQRVPQKRTASSHAAVLNGWDRSTAVPKAVAAPQPVEGNAEVPPLAAAETRPERPRKLAVMGNPKGYDRFVEKGQQRRAATEAAQRARQEEPLRNCTFQPAISDLPGNKPVKRTSIYDPASVKEWEERKQHHRERMEEQQRQREEEERQALYINLHSEKLVRESKGGEEDAVYERLNREAIARAERLRQLEAKYTPSFTPNGAPQGAAVPSLDRAHSDSEGATAEERSCPNKEGSRCNSAEAQVSQEEKRHRAEEQQRLFERLYTERGVGRHGRDTDPHSAKVNEGVPHGPEDAEVEPPSTAGDPANREKQAKKTRQEICAFTEKLLQRSAESKSKFEERVRREQAEALEELDKERRLHLSSNTAALAERARLRRQMKEELAAKAAPPAHTPLEKSLNTGADDLATVSDTSSPPPRKPREHPGELRSAASTEEQGERRTHPVSAAFVEHQRMSEERRAQGLIRLRQHLAEEEAKACTFRPQLNENSEKMALRHRYVDVLEGIQPARTAHGGTSQVPSMVRRLSREAESSPYEEEEEFEYHSVRPDLAGDSCVDDPQEDSLDAQIQSLENVMKEWAEIERDCSLPVTLPT